MTALPMPAGVLDIPAQQLIPGDVIDVLGQDHTVTRVDIYPSSHLVWVQSEPVAPLEVRVYSTVPLSMGQSVICTRRQAA